MKKRTYRKLWVPGLFLLWMPVFLFAQTFTESQSFHKSFAVEKNANVEIVNKYGKVQVFHWNKDSVRFDVEFRIGSNNLQRLNRVKAGIDFDFSSSGNIVSGKTIFKSGYANVINDLVTIAESAVSSENMVTIDYTVYLPNPVNLTIENKFGDIYMDDFDGTLQASLSNGDFKANILAGKAILDLSFGDGYINKLSDGRLTLSYSDFRIKTALQANIISKSSKVELGEINSLRLDSRRDKYQISQAATIFGSTYFTDIYMDKLSREVNLSMKYGNFNTDLVDKNFSLVRLISEYTDISLVFEKDAAYNIDITHTPDALVRLPGNLGKLEEKTSQGDPPLTMTYGDIGHGANPSKVIISSLKKATISIDQR